MYTVNLKRIFIVSLFIAIPFMLSAQLTYGTTGLLHAPSAEMQKDKTVMLGANFMNSSNVVLPHVQLLPECNHFTLDGSSIYLYFI